MSGDQPSGAVRTQPEEVNQAQGSRPRASGSRAGPAMVLAVIRPKADLRTAVIPASPVAPLPDTTALLGQDNPHILTARLVPAKAGGPAGRCRRGTHREPATQAAQQDLVTRWDLLG